LGNISRNINYLIEYHEVLKARKTKVYKKPTNPLMGGAFAMNFFGNKSLIV